MIKSLLPCCLVILGIQFGDGQDYTAYDTIYTGVDLPWSRTQRELVAEAIGLPWYNYMELLQEMLAEDPSLPLFRPDASRNIPPQQPKKFQWTSSVTPNVGPFVISPKEIKMKETLKHMQKNIKELAQQSAPERRILREVLGSRFQQLLENFQEKHRRRNKKQQIFVLEPTKLMEVERWGAALPGSDIIKRLHIEGPIPNMDPKKSPGRIRLSKLPDVNPQFPKIQPKDLERFIH